MNIRKIKIENVRGISSREFSCCVCPNMPTFFVAPNGFGKTSIATAFNSMKRDRIEIPDDNKFQNNSSALPEVEITDDGGHIYTANSTFNTITDTFSIEVISGQVKPKATTRNFGGFTSSIPELVIEPIELYSHIPDRCEFDYSVSSIKHQLGTSVGKLFLNLNSEIKKNDFVDNFYSLKNDFEKLGNTRNKRKIEFFLDEINRINNTAAYIEHCSINTATPLLSIKPINEIINKFSYLFEGYSANKKLANVIQLLYIYDKNKQTLPHIINYYKFLSDKEKFDELLKFFNCTWKNIRTSQKAGKLLIEFPKANQISNGERDVLCFIGKLFEVRNKLLRKNKAILMIDEIFDYLDDANLIAAQYFLVKFINYFKTCEKELFLIILTHLDPMFFNTYSFSIKHVVYLDQTTTIRNKYKINNLLKDRKKCQSKNQEIYNNISSNYLHYSTSNTSEIQYLRSLGVESPLHTPEGFRQKSLEELEHYQNDEDYDPILVCCGLRIYIEKNAYKQLLPEQQRNFLLTNTTREKLTFAKENGADIPEVHFLLSIIYNEAMHLDQQCQKINPITCKLRNKVIRHMITELRCF